MNEINVGGFTRVSKPVAKKLYDAGKEVFICPRLLRPDNKWAPAVPMTGDNFHRFVNHFTAYCCNRETGRYPAYYIKEK